MKRSAWTGRSGRARGVAAARHAARERRQPRAKRRPCLIVRRRMHTPSQARVRHTLYSLRLRHGAAGARGIHSFDFFFFFLTHKKSIRFSENAACRATAMQADDVLADVDGGSGDAAGVFGGARAGGGSGAPIETASASARKGRGGMDVDSGGADRYAGKSGVFDVLHADDGGGGPQKCASRRAFRSAAAVAAAGARRRAAGRYCR